MRLAKEEDSEGRDQVASRAGIFADECPREMGAQHLRGGPARLVAERRVLEKRQRDTETERRVVICGERAGDHHRQSQQRQR